MNLNSYGHITQLPIEEMYFAKIIVLTAVAIVFIILGLIGYNKRDIEG